MEGDEGPDEEESKILSIDQRFWSAISVRLAGREV